MGGVLQAQVRIDPEFPGTLYGRIGDVFGWVMLGGTGALLLVSVIRGRTGANAGPGHA